MVLLNVAIVVYFIYLYGANWWSSTTASTNQKAKEKWLLGVCLFFAFLLRIILGIIEPGYEIDMRCFGAWADSMYQYGASEFYTSVSFCDYSPGYLYVLWILGALRNHVSFLADSGLLLKLPAIITDLLTGFVIYRYAGKKTTTNRAFFFMMAYLLCPVVLIDSAMWGQIDSIYTLALVLMILLLEKKERYGAYFVFALGIFVKPQILVFTPVLLFAIIHQVILKEFRFQTFMKDLGVGVLAIISMLLLALPFRFDMYLAQSLPQKASGTFLGDSILGLFTLYQKTMNSYEYVTMNGYNFWEIFALNMHPQTEKFLGITYATYGTLWLVLLVVLVSILFAKSVCEKKEPEYFWLATILGAGFFVGSVRVHERYMFPVFALLIFVMVRSWSKKHWYLYGGILLAQANNIWHSFKYYDPANFDWHAVFPRIVGLLHTAMLGYMIYLAYTLKEQPQQTPQKELAIPKKPFHFYLKKGFLPQPSQRIKKLTKKDFICMTAITAIYAVIALFRLGDFQAPQTSLDFYEGESIELDFSGRNFPAKILYYNGTYENREYTVEESDDRVSWQPVSINAGDIYADPNGASKLTMRDVFSWESATCTVTKPYLRITLNSYDSMINELVFWDGSGAMLLPNNLSDYQELFDESNLVKQNSTYMDSAYFDEIYHARTAYEMTQGLYNYEWTHPPLGKFIISIGVGIFGMAPFGWRVMGVLFGIAMLPVLYLFIYRMSEDTFVSTLTTILMAADFMHFTQTRIATIDVYGTFFILLMYYFMYQYTQMSFYDTRLLKTFRPLLFCGIAMGLGCASKWTAVYAAVGLAVIFFFTIFVRWMEQLHALNLNQKNRSKMEQSMVEGFSINSIKTCGFCMISFVVIPALIYLLSYIPFENGEDMGLFAKMIKNQKDMWSYHSNLAATHPYSSRWYEWLTIKRPLWYFSTSLDGDVQSNISAMGNPLIWWVGLPAILFVTYHMLRYRDKKAGFLCVGYLAQLLPWTGVSRCTFIYHYFPGSVFLILMIGYSMHLLNERYKSKLLGSLLKKSFIVYVVAAVFLFAMFYPVISGYPMDISYGKYLRWFESWVLYSG